VASRPGEPWTAGVVEGVARVLGDTESGLNGGQIGQLLAQLRMEDPGADITKWKRLHIAFVDSHNRHGDPRRIVTFITEAMAPVRYRTEPGRFSYLQDSLNEVLTHVALRVNDQGKVARGARSSTVSEAARHANRLRTELRRRDLHPQVLAYCTNEILERNAFHATLEATKSVADRLRSLSGVTGDGSRLIDATLAAGRQGRPLVAINDGSSQTERDEQAGFANLCKGVFSMFRNPTAHDPRLHRTVSDEELLDALTVISLIHRRLDSAVVKP